MSEPIAEGKPNSHARWWFIGIVVLLIALAVGYNQAGKAYFRHVCENEGGEVIHRKVENVEGVFEMRPRSQPEHYSDLFVKREYPEDPHGYAFAVPGWAMVSDDPKRVPTGGKEPLGDRVKRGYVFVETLNENDHERGKYRFYRYDNYRVTTDPAELARRGTSASGLVTQQGDPVDTLRSRYGFTWSGLDRWQFRLFGVMGGQTTIVDLQTNEVIAYRKGFMRRGGGGCPKPEDMLRLNMFLMSVLNPTPIGQ